ncbi:MAG: RNA polymerase sigma factor [Candidatus Krumholzibacteriia bacterium]
MKQSDQELISKVQRGETSAFDELVYRYDRQVLSIASSFTNDPEDARDIYQEVFLRVFRSLSGFQFRSEFSTWLYRIVTNVCLTHQRRNKSRTFVSLEEELETQAHAVEASPARGPQPVSPDRHAQNAEISKYIHAALATLSPQQKLVFTLKHYQGYKLREIASMMECTEGTVKKYLFTATDKMRKRLKRVF